MRKSLLGCVLLLGGIVSAGNLLSDASFELGGTDYDARRFADITDPRQQRNITPVADPEHPVHGKVSLRFDNPYRVPLGLRSPDIALRDDTTYTFSFYARSSKPVKLRALIFSVITRDETRRNGEWDNGNRKFFTLGKAWRRYSITFTPKKGFRWYFADLLWGEGSDATVWIDAMMLSPGKTPLPFAPKSEVEFALDSPRHCRIEGEPSLVCTLSGINYGTRGTEAEVVLREFDDYRETKLGERRWKGKLPPGGEVVRQNLPVERKEYGVYSLRGEFRTASGEQGTIWPYCYAVTGKYQPGTVDPAKDFLLGSEESFGFECPDINGGRAWYHLKGADFAEYNRLAANRGVRLLRLGNGIWRAIAMRQADSAGLLLQDSCRSPERWRCFSEEIWIFAQSRGQVGDRFVHCFLHKFRICENVIAQAVIHPLPELPGTVECVFPDDMILFLQGHADRQCIFRIPCRRSQKPEQRTVQRQSIGPHVALIFRGLNFPCQNQIGFLLFSAEGEISVLEQMGTAQTQCGGLCQIFRRGKFKFIDRNKHSCGIRPIIFNPAERHQRNQIQEQRADGILRISAIVKRRDCDGPPGQGRGRHTSQLVHFRRINKLRGGTASG